MQGEAVDRPPLLEEGVREEVIEVWHTQGLPAGKSHIQVFGLFPHEIVVPDLRFRTAYYGRVPDLTESEYRKAFDVSPDRLPEDWEATVERLRKRNHVVGLWVSRGFFQALGVGDWPTLERVLVGVTEDPARIRRRMELYGDFCAAMLDKMLDQIDPEFLYLSEPICDNTRPLISPAMFESLAIPAYERIIAAARSRGCRHILLGTYGNAALLLPTLVKAGITILWISEAPEVPELDYRNLRAQYGPELGLVGGIPLSILRLDSPRQMQHRLEETVRPLLESGRYIPLASGRVREDISWPQYRQYRGLLNRLINAGRRRDPRT